MEAQSQPETSLTKPGGMDMPKENHSAHVDGVKKLLFRRMLVGVNDGRFFMGNFYCLDKQGNIILQDAVEYRSMLHNSPTPLEQRCLGLILIPSSCRTSCHVDSSIEEQLALLSLQRQKCFTSIRIKVRYNIHELLWKKNCSAWFSPDCSQF